MKFKEYLKLKLNINEAVKKDPDKIENKNIKNDIFKHFPFIGTGDIQQVGGYIGVQSEKGIQTVFDIKKLLKLKTFDNIGLLDGKLYIFFK